MKSKIKKMAKPVGIGVIAAIAVIVVGIVLKNSRKTAVEKVVQAEEKSREIISNMANGCIFRGIEDETLKTLLMLSQGQVCLQILDSTIKDQLSGKGYCSDSDKECLFKVGYAKVSVMLSRSSLTAEEINLIEEQAKVSFETFKSQQGQ